MPRKLYTNKLTYEKECSFTDSETDIEDIEDTDGEMVAPILFSSSYASTSILHVSTASNSRPSTKRNNLS
uniref:Uncharacterized protein n=1 Tax=Candidatus Berkiella aquae TaxID=295108 RepID=A0A0Q9YNC9_9GAMM